MKAKRLLLLFSLLALALVALLVYALLYGANYGRPGGSAGGTGVPVISAAELGTPQNEYMPVRGAPRQLIIFYTGDTLSIPDANTSYTPPQGGLSALAQELLTYQRRIVEYNRVRVEDEGGDVSKITADYAHNMLGEHPYLLLDYGGWERLNDPVGESYVKLFAEFFERFNYTAVGSKMFSEVPAEKWEKYRSVAPQLQLLVSAGTAEGTPLPVLPLVTRTVHGELWGIAAVPLPDMRGVGRKEGFARIESSFTDYVDTAAGQLAASGCKYSILLAPGWGKDQYSKLKDDKRFTLVLGVNPRVAVEGGFGELPAAGPLLLPELTARGRQLGVCHLYWPVQGSRPDKYLLSLRETLDDPTAAYPYRRQVNDALREHSNALTALGETATIQAE